MPFLALIITFSISENETLRLSPVLLSSRTQYDPDVSLTGNAKICCLSLILALF